MKIESRIFGFGVFFFIPISIIYGFLTGWSEWVGILGVLLLGGLGKIGFVSNPSEMYTLSERLAGYRQALMEVGVADSTPWERLDNDPSITHESQVRSLLDSSDPPTAIVTGNNRATMGALRELRTR